MRIPERIDNFLRLVDFGILAQRWQIIYELLNDLANDSTTFDGVIEYWKANPDQRFGQVLINLGLVPDTMIIWTDEENDILHDQNIAPEEYLYWTSVYDKDDNLLEQPIARLIKDLDTDHIEKILALFNDKLEPEYKQAFNRVLFYRESGTVAPNSEDEEFAKLLYDIDKLM